MFTKQHRKFNPFFCFCFSLVLTGICIILLVLTCYSFASYSTKEQSKPIFVTQKQSKLNCSSVVQPISKEIFTKLESVQLPVTFEEEVALEVKRICADVYPNLSSDYILAIVYHESRFQPNAVNSKTGATGLMQILPQWHTARASSLGVSLSDWKGNILTGCDILNEMAQAKHSMHYAVNFYAGGYGYANYYESSGRQSPYEIELNNILKSGVLKELGVM